MGIRIGTKRYWYKASARDHIMAAPRPWPHPSGAQRGTGGGKLCSSQLNPCQLIKSFVKLKAAKWFIRCLSICLMCVNLSSKYDQFYSLIQNCWQFDTRRFGIIRTRLRSPHSHPRVTGWHTDTRTPETVIRQQGQGGRGAVGPIQDQGGREMKMSVRSD